MTLEPVLRPAGVTELPSNRAIVLHNVNCAYCSRPFDAELTLTKEHVIGRRFVPRGCLAGQWNLILNACGQCNGDKADLEDDISVITMMPDTHGRHAVDDDRLRAEVARKAVKARSRRTGKAVIESHEQLQMHGAFGPATFNFNFVAPAQVEEERLFRLAHYHVRGFFYWITYQLETRRGGFVPGGFYPVGAVRRADWGAPRLRWFMDLVRTWDPRVHAIGADGFFKLLIRRHREDAPVWCWAVEWNHGMRVFGFAGDEAIVRALIEEMPDQPMELIHETEKEWIRVRTEAALPEADDDLFSVLVEVEAAIGEETAIGKADPDPVQADPSADEPSMS